MGTCVAVPAVTQHDLPAAGYDAGEYSRAGLATACSHQLNLTRCKASYVLASDYSPLHASASLHTADNDARCPRSSRGQWTLHTATLEMLLEFGCSDSKKFS